MSIEWMTHVWNNSNQRGTRLLMMLAIADYANEEGIAYPGLESLARKTRQTKRNTIRIIEKIVSDKELEIDTKASHLGTNLYQLKVSTRKPKKRVVTIRAGGDILGKEGGDISVPEMSPDPSLPISDPSLGADAPNGKKPRAKNEMFDVLAEVCHLDAKASGGYIGKTAADLKDYNPADIRRWYSPGGWWYKVRCANMEPKPVPSLSGIAKTIKLAADSDKPKVIVVR